MGVSKEALMLLRPRQKELVGKTVDALIASIATRWPSRH